jgi:hypothetical protein
MKLALFAYKIDEGNTGNTLDSTHGDFTLPDGLPAHVKS